MDDDVVQEEAKSIVKQAKKFCSLAGMPGVECEQIALEMVLNADDKELFRKYVQDLMDMTGKSKDQIGDMMKLSCDCEVPK